MSAHTPGPWRWEVALDGKRIELVGGRPLFDKTVMDFKRWGMSSSAPRFNSAIVGDEFNTMYAPHEYRGWVIPFEGREHHAHWCADIDHPDARLITAAPDLLEALQKIAERHSDRSVDGQLAREAIAKATGSEK